jgi:hypothetical protein
MPVVVVASFFSFLSCGIQLSPPYLAHFGDGIFLVSTFFFFSLLVPKISVTSLRLSPFDLATWIQTSVTETPAQFFGTNEKMSAM